MVILLEVIRLGQLKTMVGLVTILVSAVVDNDSVKQDITDVR